MLARRLVGPDSLPVGSGLQGQGNGKGNDDRRRNGVLAITVVMAEPAEMKTADDHEDEDQRKERDPYERAPSCS